MVFIIINALHVSGGSFAHHQELKTLYTASGICRAFSASYRYCEWVGGSNSLTIAVRSRKRSTNTRCCVYGFELLMMGEGTAWNMLAFIVINTICNVASCWFFFSTFICLCKAMPTADVMWRGVRYDRTFWQFSLLSLVLKVHTVSYLANVIVIHIGPVWFLLHMKLRSDFMLLWSGLLCKIFLEQKIHVSFSPSTWICSILFLKAHKA